MRTRQIRKTYPAMPFDIAEAKLSRELELYYQAIHSYPDHFARTRLSFQRHLLNIMNVVNVPESSGAECMKSAS